MGAVQNGESRLMGELLSLLSPFFLFHLGNPLPLAFSLLLLLLVSLSQSRHLLSVIELGGLYYYDSSDLIVNKTFQLEFRGLGQGMGGQWSAAAQEWGRRSRGATVRLESLGEKLRARRCGHALCFESVVQPGNFLATEWDSRLVWRSGCGLNHENFFWCFASPPTAGLLATPGLSVRSLPREVCREGTHCLGLLTGFLFGAHRMNVGMATLHLIGVSQSNPK